jgi:hypothetical protein
MSSPVLVKEGITNSFAVISEADGLLDLAKYYWQVWAIDSYGAITKSEIRNFTTDNTNAGRALIKGIITNSNGEPVPDAAITVSGKTDTFVYVSEIYGDYLFWALPGDYSVFANTSGYQSDTSGFNVAAGQTLVKNITLRPQTQNVFIVTKDITGSGYVECPTSVNNGAQLTCLIQAGAGYKVNSITGCNNGVLTGNQFTSVITSDCTIAAVFSPIDPENGVCGENSNNKSFDTEPAIDSLCGAGDPTLPEFSEVPGPGSGWGWTCKGRYTGVDNKTCKALINMYPLTVTIDDIAGTVAPDILNSLTCNSSNCTGSFIYGKSVTLTASANSGFRFTGWASDCSGTDTCKVTMNSSKAVGATFIQTFPINFTSGPDSGASYLSGAVNQTVDLNSSASPVTAVAAAGYRFVNWTEGDNILSTAPELTAGPVTAPHTYTANFDSEKYTITTNAGAGGGITPTTTVNYGASATITVRPDPGYTITQVSVDGTPQLVSDPKGFSKTFYNVKDNHTVSATFDYYSLTVNIVNAGMVHGSISCDMNSCGYGFPFNTPIALFATNSSKTTFVRWEGACVGTDKNSCNFTMGTDKTVTAYFLGQIQKPFRINGVDHSDLQGAYKDPAVAPKIRIMSGTWPANEAGPMIADENKEITFEGRFNELFSDPPNGDDTIIEGGIKIKAGKVNMKGVKVR